MERVKQSMGGGELECAIKETLSRSFDTHEGKANGAVAGRGVVALRSSH